MSLSSDSPSAPAIPALAHNIAVLDCAAVLELFRRHLSTPLGYDRLQHLEFLHDRAALEREQALVGETLAWAAVHGAPGFSGMHDPRPLCEQAGLAGSMLEPEQLLHVVAFVERSEELRRALSGDVQREATDFPLLQELGRRLPPLGDLHVALRGRILPSGDIDDHASPQLNRIRREIEKQRKAIESALNQQMRRLSADGILQDELITIRGDRFVLPVKVEQRRRVPGVIHGGSSSGQTVYMEPLETIDLNNDLIRLLDDEQAEIRRILTEMTASVGAAAPALTLASHICGELEFQFAKARFAREFDAGAATFAPDGDPRLELRDARHPVLVATLRAQRREVVPLAVEMAQQRVLVISGPNTGGKTVALKTVGVAAWMAQCGLPVCAASATLPIFDAILADIGDAQSISESLSTFSSHLLHIRGILAEASSRTLVLLDELGAATSPSEGAALAVAISESLRQRSAWTLISTHHDDLKAWATSQPDVLNASVGFDTASLQPTYHFRIGIPGVSAGLDMAQRLGLQSEIVAAARQLMTAEERKASEFLRRLQEELAAAEQERRQLAERLEWVRRREAELERSDRADLQRKLATLERQFEQLSRRWEREVQNAAKAIEDQAAALQLKKEADRTAARLRQEAHEAFRAQVMSTMGTPAPEPTPQRPSDIRVGDRVRLENVQKIGRVLRREGSRLEVEVGHLRLRAGIHEVVEVLNEAGTPITPRISGAELDADRMDQGNLLELNLIGQRTDEAVDRLEKFLDNAVLSELTQVRIIHGFGTGALRRAVADALRHHSQVARYYHPPHNEGGNGVTIAEMKQ